MLLGEVTAFVAAALLAACATALVRRHALARGRLDVPNARSSHTEPTPRGGGLAIVVIVLAATIVATLLADLPNAESAALVVGGGMVAAVGYCDDVRGLSILPRLTVHLVAAAIAV